MKHLNANLDNTTNIEVPLINTTRILGLDADNNIVEMDPAGGPDFGDDDFNGDGMDMLDTDDGMDVGDTTPGEEFCYTLDGDLHPCYSVGGNVRITATTGSSYVLTEVTSITTTPGTGTPAAGDCDNVQEGDAITGEYWEWEIVSQTLGELPWGDFNGNFYDHGIDWPWIYPNGLENWLLFTTEGGQNGVADGSGMNYDVFTGRRIYGRFGTNGFPNAEDANNTPIGQTYTSNRGGSEGTTVLRKIRRISEAPAPQWWVHSANLSVTPFDRALLLQRSVFPINANGAIRSITDSDTGNSYRIFNGGWMPLGTTNAERDAFIASHVTNGIYSVGLIADSTNAFDGSGDLITCTGDGTFMPGDSTTTTTHEICVRSVQSVGDGSTGSLSLTNGGTYNFMPICDILDLDDTVDRPVDPLDMNPDLEGDTVDCDTIEGSGNIVVASGASTGRVLYDLATDSWTSSYTNIREAEVQNPPLTDFLGGDRPGLLSQNPASYPSGVVPANIATDFTALQTAIRDGVADHATGGGIYARFFQGPNRVQVDYPLADVAYYPYNPGFGLDNRFMFFTYAAGADTPQERVDIHSSAGTPFGSPSTQNWQIVDYGQSTTAPVTAVEEGSTLDLDVADAAYDATEYYIGRDVRVTNGDGATFTATISSQDVTGATRSMIRRVNPYIRAGAGVTEIRSVNSYGFGTGSGYSGRFTLTVLASELTGITINAGSTFTYLNRDSGFVVDADYTQPAAVRYDSLVSGVTDATMVVQITGTVGRYANEFDEVGATLPTIRIVTQPVSATSTRFGLSAISNFTPALAAGESLTLSTPFSIDCANNEGPDDVVINPDGDVIVGDLCVDGDGEIEGDLDVDGDGEFGGDLIVDGDGMTGGDSLVRGDQQVDGSICQGGSSFTEAANIFATAVSAGALYQGEVVSGVLISAVLNNYRLHATLSVGDYMIFQNTDPTDTTDTDDPTSFTSGTYEITSKTDGTPNILGISRVSGNFKFNQATAEITTYTGGTCTVGGDVVVDGDLVVDGDILGDGDVGVGADGAICQGGTMTSALISRSDLSSIGLFGTDIVSFQLDATIQAALFPTLNNGDEIGFNNGTNSTSGFFEYVNNDRVTNMWSFVAGGFDIPDGATDQVVRAYRGGTCILGDVVVADDIIVDGDLMVEDEVCVNTDTIRWTTPLLNQVTASVNGVANTVLTFSITDAGLAQLFEADEFVNIEDPATMNSGTYRINSISGSTVNFGLVTRNGLIATATLPAVSITYGGICAGGDGILADGDLIVDGDVRFRRDLVVDGYICTGGFAGTTVVGDRADDFATGGQGLLSYGGQVVVFTPTGDLLAHINAVRGDGDVTNNNILQGDEFNIYDDDGTRDGIFRVIDAAGPIFGYRSGTISPIDFAPGAAITFAYGTTCMRGGDVMGDEIVVNAACINAAGVTVPVLGSMITGTNPITAFNISGEVAYQIGRSFMDFGPTGVFPAVGNRAFVRQGGTSGLYEFTTTTLDPDETDPTVRAGHSIQLTRIDGSLETSPSNAYQFVFDGACTQGGDMILMGAINPLGGVMREVTGPVNDRSDIGGVRTWSGTRAQYDAITTKDPNVIYNIR